MIAQEKTRPRPGFRISFAVLAALRYAVVQSKHVASITHKHPQRARTAFTVADFERSKQAVVTIPGLNFQCNVIVGTPTEQTKELVHRHKVRGSGSTITVPDTAKVEAEKISKTIELHTALSGPYCLK